MEVVHRSFSGGNDMFCQSKLVVACVMTQVVWFAMVIALLIILGPEWAKLEERVAWTLLAGLVFQAFCWVGIFVFDLPKSATDSLSKSQPS